MSTLRQNITWQIKVTAITVYALGRVAHKTLVHYHGCFMYVYPSQIFSLILE